MGDSIDSMACAGLLLLSMAVAGAAQTAWFKVPLSARFAWPLDGGASFRGRRLFGANKTVRGFVVIVPVGALAMMAVGTAMLKAGARVWALSPLQLAALGAVAATGLMLGELPNSFIKRQLDIGPGDPPKRAWARWLCFTTDRLDSVFGTLIAVSLMVPMSWGVWAWALVLGPPLHYSFSIALWLLGVKQRPA